MKFVAIVFDVIILIFFGYEVFNHFARGNIIGMIFFLLFLAISGWSMWHKKRKSP